MTTTTGRVASLALTLAALPFGAAGAQDRPTGTPAAAAGRVVDGDTVELRTGDSTVKARIVGIDAPESVHPSKPVERFGKEAAKHLRELAGGEAVTVEREPGSKQDRHGRELVYLRLADGRDVGRAMIRDGFAHHYPKYPHGRMDDDRAAEREAREAKAGLWGEDPPAVETPPPARSWSTSPRPGRSITRRGAGTWRSRRVPCPWPRPPRGGRLARSAGRQYRELGRAIRRQC